MTKDRFDEIGIGDEAEIIHTITAEDVNSFVKLTGDENPLHVDPAYAATTSFKKPVVHGMLAASFVSTLIGTKLPGKGSLWYENKARFLAPVRVGETIRVWARVRHKSPSERIVVLDIVVDGEKGRRCMEGEAKVKVLESNEQKENNMPEEQKGAVIVSGGGTGIGAAIAKELSGAGYCVVVNYAQNELDAEDVVREIRDKKGSALAFRADVSDKRAVGEMVQSTLSEFKIISGVVNNASGPIEDLGFDELSWDVFQRHIDVQIKGAFHLTQAILPHLLRRQHGIIVNIASTVADNVPPVKWMPYNVVKAALVSFSRCLAAEYGPKQIRVNCVSPGMTSTDLIANVPAKVKMVTKMATPLRRLAVPDDIAGAVAFLFSDRAAHITGQNIRVCGGIVMS